MLPLPSFLAPAALAARVLNQLLRREEWARERLARYSGKTVRFVVGRLKTGFTLQANGYVEAANPVIVPDVTLTIPQDRLVDLPAALRAGDPALVAQIMHVQGDAGLAHLVSDLTRDLRWDIEEDLSAVVGDVAAVRLMAAAQAFLGSARAAGDHLAANVSEYLSQESAVLVNRPAFEAWAAKLNDLRSRLDALESRASIAARRTTSHGHGI